METKLRSQITVSMSSTYFFASFFQFLEKNNNLNSKIANRSCGVCVGRKHDDHGFHHLP